MRWQKWARRIVGLAGIGLAVTIYMLTRERPATVTHPGADLRGADMSAGAGTDTRQRGDKTVGTIVYEAIETYKDGRVRYTKPRFTNADGSVLSADVVESTG